MGAKIYDTIIVGAGAAGIACALQLETRQDILLLEARERIGGRIHSRPNESGLPTELGAEFIHGAPRTTMELVEHFRLAFVDVVDTHLFLEKNKLRNTPEFWEQVGQLTGKLRQNGRKDRSVAEFLESHKVKAKTKALFASYVEGFHSADMNIIGEHGLAITEQSEVKELNGAKMFRLTEGYSSFMEMLLRSGKSLREHIRFHRAVKRVDWSESTISVHTQSPMDGTREVFRCRKLVLTVPLGVLKAPPPLGIEWFPQAPSQLGDTLQKLHMGHVQRLTLRFRSRFWETIFDEPISFLHTNTAHFFPTWWTSSPLRDYRLVAWQGGPKAEELSHYGMQEKLEAALTTLGRLTKKSRTFLHSELEAVDTHDWSNDPFSLGAYSYIGVAGVPASLRLRRPFEGRIFFAGEAAAEGYARGTVDGALQSGQRVARQLLRSGTRKPMA